MFIKEISFPEWHPFYNNWKPITFRNAQSDLIDFYLKTTKKIKDWEKDINFGNNIQINCILWDNGAGKSRLIWEILNWKEKCYIKWLPSNHSFILDDYYVASSNFSLSINKEFLGSIVSGEWWINSFLKDSYNFLKKTSTISTIYYNFLNISSSYEYTLNITEKDWRSEITKWYPTGYHQHNIKEHLSRWEHINTWKFGQRVMDLAQSFIRSDQGNLIKSLKSFENNKFFILMYHFYDLIESWIDMPHILQSDWLMTILKWLIFFKEILVSIESQPISLDDEFIKNLRLSISRVDILISAFALYEKWNHEVSSTKLKEIIPLIENEVTESAEFSSTKQFLESYTGNNGNCRGENDFCKKFIYGNKPFDIFHTIKAAFPEIWEYSYNGNSIDDIDFSIFHFDQYFSVNLIFNDKNNGLIKDFNSLSSWEKTMLIRIVNITRKIEQLYQSWNRSFTILIDEPDLHLHLDWQRQYIQKLIDIFSSIQYPEKISLHFIIATHSPFIVSDLPGENIIRIKKNLDEKITFSEYGANDWKEKKSSFWANYIDIIQEWFFVNRLLMWSFAEEVITNLAIAEKIKVLWKNFKDTEETKEIKNYIDSQESTTKDWKDKIDEMKKMIWDTFVRNHLLYF